MTLGEEARSRTLPGGSSTLTPRHVVLAMPLMLLPFLVGGARPWFWSIAAGLFFVGVVVLLWVDVTFPRRSAGGKWILLPGALLIYPFLQAIPIPRSWLEALSPQHVAWLEHASRVAPHPGQWSASTSYDPLATSMAAVFWVFLAVFAWVLHATLREERELKWLCSLLFLFVGIEALYGLIQVLAPDVGVLWLRGEGGTYRGLARGTFINRNHFAAFVGMVWPVLFCRILGMGETPGDGAGAGVIGSKPMQGKERQRQLFFSFIVGLILLALFFSQSRGGIIGAMVAMTVLAVMLRTRRRGLIVLVAVVWVVALGYGSIIGFDEILNRFDQMEKDAPGRFRLWQDSMEMIADHPWTGTGAGTYGLVFKLYQTHIPENLQASHAHNDYVQLVAELGWPAAAAVMLLAWGYWWRAAIREWRVGKVHRPAESMLPRGSESRRPGRTKETREPGGDAGKSRGVGGEGSSRTERQSHLIAVGALAGAAAFLCHSWVEFNWQIPANQLYFVMLLVLMSRGPTLEYLQKTPTRG